MSGSNWPKGLQIKKNIKKIYTLLDYFRPFVDFWLTMPFIDFVANHQMHIPTTFGSYWLSGLREEYQNVNVYWRGRVQVWQYLFILPFLVYINLNLDFGNSFTFVTLLNLARVDKYSNTMFCVETNLTLCKTTLVLRKVLWPFLSQHIRCFSWSFFEHSNNC